VTTIRALLPSDDRTSFQSGDVELDRFFTKYAGQNQFRHHIGTSYVAMDDDGHVLGYATVSPASILIDSMPAAQRKKLPTYPMPVLRLARLAVDKTAQGQGLGSALLKYVFQLALRMASDYGCVGVVVDAKSTAASFYRQYGFTAFELIAGESQARPQPLAMFLSIRELELAAK
jgi:GNAT superfamily N-acetyltransferase